MLLPESQFKMHSYYTGKQLYLQFIFLEIGSSTPSVQRCQQLTASCQLLGLPLLQTNSRGPLNTALWTCFRRTKVKTWNFSTVQIHGRWHVQLPLFVPVKCALALINWHYYIPLPHLSLLPLYSPTPFHGPSHTFLSLPALWVLLTKGMSRPTSQRHTRLYHKNCTWINLSF